MGGVALVLAAWSSSNYSEPGQPDWNVGDVRVVEKKHADLLVDQFPGCFVSESEWRKKLLADAKADLAKAQAAFEAAAARLEEAREAAAEPEPEPEKDEPKEGEPKDPGAATDKASDADSKKKGKG